MTGTPMFQLQAKCLLLHQLHVESESPYTRDDV